MRRGVLEQLGVSPWIGGSSRPSGIRRGGVGETGLMLWGRRIVPVVFGEEDGVAVIGVTALEIFGLEVDVIRGGA